MGWEKKTGYSQEAFFNATAALVIRVYQIYGGVYGGAFIVLRNEQGTLNLNPRWGCLHFAWC